MKALYFLILSILFFSSCDKFDWDNPYDPECPKEIFTPSSAGATMEGNSVKLTWTQENDYISGFALFRSAEGESIASLTQTQKNTTQYLDANFTPGKKYTYYIVAVAGTNKSDTVKAEIVPVIPITISTGAVSELAATSAKASGNITNTGGGTVTSRGICWSTIPNPTVNSSKTTEGTGAGEFTSTLTNLLAGTTYYARAYGENSRGISYGSEVTFTTLGPPKLTTTAVSNITSTSATSGGTIISDGGSPITAKGVVWSTMPNPTIALATKTDDGTGLGSFATNLNNLTSNAKYYCRAYATNLIGTSYGEEFSFTTLIPNAVGVVTDIDGNIYTEVKIGDQIWMGENLKVTRYKNGDKINFISNVPTTPWGVQNTVGNYCVHSNNSSNTAIYGNMYNWAAVTDPRGLAPEGWRVPTSDDWQKLIDFLGPDAINKLISTGTLEMGTGLWRFPSNGNNLSGMNIHPSGYIFDQFADLGTSAFIWTSTGNAANKSAIAMVLAGGGGLGGWSTQYGLVVRCIKN
jgi:uncharacterized protein (TIGR02145 family)